VKRLILTAATLFALTATAHAFGDVVIAPPAAQKPDRGNGADDHPFPFDAGSMNESPIRGRGQIYVNHNMPSPDDTDRKLTDALWLLQDNSWTCYKPNVKASRR
jgi:hypothetical protein